MLIIVRLNLIRLILNDNPNLRAEPFALIHMKFILIFSFLVLTANIGFSQSNNPIDKDIRKGRMYFYWGWNWGGFSKSNITFTGDDYNFTLKEVVAYDRQSNFSADTYLNPANMTIPQYNFRVGYYLKEDWDISFGIDHMKYVVQQNQTVKISGNIDDTLSKYNGVYSDDDMVLANDFLEFEHTDGLNYINIEVRHTDQIFDFGKIVVNLKEGVGVGTLLPKTNTYLLERERYDEFHLSGYGLSGVVGLNVTFFNNFFVQSEFKGGYMNLPDVRTTSSVGDKASQSFFFSQLNIVFGGVIDLNKKK